MVSVNLASIFKFVNDSDLVRAWFIDQRGGGGSGRSTYTVTVQVLQGAAIGEAEHFVVFHSAAQNAKDRPAAASVVTHRQIVIAIVRNASVLNVCSSVAVVSPHSSVKPRCSATRVHLIEHRVSAVGVVGDQ